jgi:uncharacterized protein (DUF1697 family)
MATFVALLRGVNVGRANRVAMADWRAQLESLGYKSVETLLNSGNAVFESAGRSTAKHAEAIHAALAATGVVTPVVVVSAAALAEIVTHCPIPPPVGDESKFLVIFPPDVGALPGLEPLRPLVRGAERFEIGPNAAYLYCPGGVLESAASSALLGKDMRAFTTRNWATVSKLKALTDKGGKHNG